MHWLMHSICTTICNTTFETTLKESNVRKAYLIVEIQIKIIDSLYIRFFEYLFHISYRLEL